MEKSKELVKNTLIITIGKISTQIISFLLLPLYTYKLSAAEYGNYDFITTVAFFLVPFMTLLLEEAMFRFLIDAKEEEKKRVVSSAFWFIIFNSVLLSVILLLITKITNYNLGYYILIYTISNAFVAISNALARGEQRIKLFSFSNFLLGFTTIALNLIFILCLNMGFLSLILSSVIANIAISIFVFCRLRVQKIVKLKDYKFSIVKSMLKYSIPLIPNMLAWTIINLSDRLIIMYVLGAKFNGIYSLAYKYPTIISSFYSYFNTAWRETSAKIVNDRDYKSFNEIYKNIKNILFSVTICLISIMPFIYKLFYNNEYYSGIYLIPIISISLFYETLSGFYGGIFTAFKKTKVLAITSFVSSIINILVNVLFIKVLGLYAAAISTFVASFIIYIYRKICSKKFLAFKDKNYLYIIAFLFVLVCFYFANSLIAKIVLLIFSIALSVILNKNLLYVFYRKIKNSFFKFENAK